MMRITKENFSEYFFALKKDSDNSMTIVDENAPQADSKCLMMVGRVNGDEFRMIFNFPNVPIAFEEIEECLPELMAKTFETDDYDYFPIWGRPLIEFSDKAKGLTWEG